ncbi:hypothetical protein J437_LFUL019543 [Ladona fulva]|uniref:Cytochrome P450 n=1 Tax=Ladona fulva TaxID=123851 RepID=A0A8K0KT51_LADFU|nr:hypothetical protein J437_LFUL019543 [Ladona fulva]
MIRDPELLKNILVKDFSSFYDNHIFVTPQDDPMMGRSIFFMHGELWKRTRSSLSPAFSPGRIKGMMPLIQELCQDLVDYLDEQGGGQQELKGLFVSFTTNVVASCAFGIKTDSLRRPDDEFRTMANKMVAPTPIRGLAQLLVLNLPSLARLLRVKMVPDDVADFFRQVVKDVSTARDKSGQTRNDFLNLMMLLKNAGKLGIFFVYI